MQPVCAPFRPSSFDPKRRWLRGILTYRGFILPQSPPIPLDFEIKRNKPSDGEHWSTSHGGRRALSRWPPPPPQGSQDDRCQAALGSDFVAQLDLSETIADVKAMIYEQEGTHPMQQVLIFSGQRLGDDHRTLADYGVQHGPSSTLYLVKLLPVIIISPPLLSFQVKLHVKFCQCSLSFVVAC